MHGKSIRIPGPQDLRARRVVHRDPVPGEAGGGGSAGTLSATERRHETVGVRHTANPHAVGVAGGARDYTNIIRPASRGEPDVP